jgi:DNA-binding NarL/FixJ family response regulator
MRILIVDDHILFRESLALLLKEHRPEVRLIEASTGTDALQAVALYEDFDLILLDLLLPGQGGLEVLPQLRETAPTIPVMVLSGTEDRTAAIAALELGAVGYVHKSAGSQEMRNALDLVLQGEIYAPLAMLATQEPAPARAPSGSAAPIPCGLTTRQLDVLKLLAQGLPNKSIARTLDLSEATVKLHVSAILRALGTRNRTEAVLKATQRGFIGSAALD